MSTQSGQETTKPVDANSFDSLLSGLLVPDSKGQVNEEQLFAALINERLTSMKGDEAAEEFESRYLEEQNKHQGADGYIFLEDSARAALESMSDDGMLTLEEAETIHAQAFKGAQFDDNKSALYDSFGSTMAVTLLEMAIQSAEDEITQFDSGTASAGRLAFDFENSTADSNLVSSLDGEYSDGLIWKPASDTNGNAAIILDSSLQNKIDSVTLLDSAGNQLEEKGVLKVDERGRSILLFDQPGADYSNNLTVRVELDDGESIQYLVANPSDRLGY